MKKILLINLIILSIFSNLYGNGTKEIENQKPLISVSILPEKTFVEKVVKNKMDIQTLVKKGSSPENCELTPKERAKFEDSDIYFSMGVPTEKITILPYVSNKTKVISLSDEVEKTYPTLKIGSSRDPHIWLSPKRVISMVTSITKEVSKIDPKNKEFYESNAKEYIKQLEELDNYLTSYLSNLKNKEFIVYHPAFGYFADDYNLTCNVIEIDGKEITTKSLSQLITHAKKENIKNVFYQAEISEEQSNTIANELGGKTIQLNPLSEDYINNLKQTAKLIKENI